MNWKQRYQQILNISLTEVEDVITGDVDTITAGVSNWYILRDELTFYNNQLVFNLRPNPTGVIRVEYTLDDEEVVKTGSPVALPWPSGDVSVDSCLVVKAAITAWRFVLTSGNARANVKGFYS